MGGRCRALRKPHDKREENPGQLDDQQCQQEAQADAHADYNEHEFGVMSKVGNGVPPIQKLAHLRDRYQEDGGNRDEGLEPAVHTFIVTSHLLLSPRRSLWSGFTTSWN